MLFSPPMRKLILLPALLLAGICAAQSSKRPQTAVTSSAASATTTAADNCTTLDGRPVPCPTENGNSASPVASPSPTSGGDRCTTLDGREVPCPDEATGEAAAPIAPVKPARKERAASRKQRTPTPAAGATSASGEPAPAALPASGDVPQVTAGCTKLNGATALPCPPEYSPSEAEQKRPAPESSEHVGSVNWMVRSFAADQKAFWTSPLHIREQDLDWLVPFAGLTAVTIGSDRGIEGHLPTSAAIIKNSKSFSNYAVAGMVAGGAGMFAWGHLTQNDRMSETGFLSGEAAVNSVAIAEGIKLIAGRQRPLDGNGRGNFWSGGNSFPSIHSVAAWSIASVIAHEYPGIIPTMFSYGAAAAVSATRVTGRQHWASDVLIGSALGWYMGRQVYRAHSADLKGSADWGTFVRSADHPRRPPSRMGSPYVPLDSWVYAALDRLAAMGYVQTAISGLRPWTRMECARLVQEAADNIEGADAPRSVVSLYDDLRQEFRGEVGLLQGGRNLGAQVDSIYTRVTGISGQPLTDSYHFGQTIYNDYGRPYQEGFNLVTGTSVQAEAGPLAFFVRGEFQHAPGAPGYSLATRQAIASADQMPLLPSSPVNAVNRARLLDGYVSLNLNNWQLSFGQQSLWWGPGSADEIMFSNNAEPIRMLRLDRVTPLKLPGLFGWLGEMRTQSFFGQLQGQQFVRLTQGLVLQGMPGVDLNPQPYIYGNKINFAPTQNLEFGVSLTSLFSGPGRPFTMQTLLHTLSGRGSNQPLDPGDRRSGFDFRYRIPGLRNWLQLYSGGLTEDDISPIAYPRRSAFSPGIYMPRLPGLPNVDLRVESIYTDLPGLRNSGFYYWNLHYEDGYRNNNQLLASWVGRQGVGLTAQSTVWLSAQRKIQFGYRHQTVDKSFIGGGNLTDASARADWLVHGRWTVSSLLQYERWVFPQLATGVQTNFTTAFQLTFHPRFFGGATGRRAP